MDVQRRKAKCFIIVIATIMAFCAAQVIEADEVVSTELVGVEDTEISQNNLPTETEMPGNIEIVQDEEPEDVEGSNVQDIIVDEMEFDSDEIESDIMSQEMTEGLLDDEENIQQGTEKDVDSELAEISLGEDGLEVDLSGMINPAPVSLTIYDMLGTWEGGYSYEADNETECTFLLNISDCTDDGQINGYAEIGTQKVTGFFFDGTVDFQSGSISFAVTEWMDNPQDSAVEFFSGTVDLLNMEMSGIVNSDENSSFKLSKALDDYGAMMMRSDAEEEEIPDYDIWLANTLISGFENDGNGLYKVFRNTFGEPVYSLMGAHLMEDEPLVIISTAWSVYLNSEYRNQFANEQKYIYEVLLMEYLKYDSNSSARKIDLYNNEMKFSIKLFSAITTGVSGSRKDHLNSMTPEEALRFYDNLDWADDLSSALSELKTGYSTVKELINGISEYKALEQVRNERVALLKAARDACASSSSPNRDFIQAVNELINMIEGSKLQYIQGKSMDYLLEQDLNFLWGQLCNANPVLSGIEFGISGLDMCFDSTNRASNDLKLALLYTVDQYMKMGMMNASTSYLDEKTSKNAQTFIACFEAYVQFQMYGNKFISTWLNDYLDGGIFSDIINMVFYQENIQTAEELLALAKSQTENREHLLGRISDWADLYEGLYKPDEWDDFQSNVPVTGVTFLEPSYTIGKSDGVLVHAQIQPENATNKNIIYSSSDPAILEVSSGGGFATVHGMGTVTITARTEEGNFVAYQNITIEDRVAVTFRGEGSCGENLKWKETMDGTLYIYGQGEMKDYYSYSNIRWKNIKRLIISSGVTHIGNYAFYGCSNLTGDLNFPAGLASIGDSAFSGCEKLNSVSFPEGMTSIGADAFSGCSSLTGGLSFPKGLTSIGNSAFEDCSSLTGGLSFPVGLMSIGVSAFKGCSSLTGGLSFPEGLTSIGWMAFYGCSELSGSLSFSEGLTSIGASAFDGCSSLTGGLSFPKGLTSIGDDAFFGCSGLTGGLSFPKGLTSIGSGAFDGCSSLTGGLSFPKGLTSIGDGAFFGCSGLTGGLSFPKGLTSIGYSAFEDCSSLTGGLSFQEGLTSIGDSAFEECSSLTGGLSFPVGLTSIGASAFKGCNSLTGGLSFPEGLTSIGDSAFSGCSNLAGNLSFQEGLTSIGDEAFYECSSLTGGVSFPEGLTSIGNDAFSECSDLSSVSFPKGLTSIGDFAFLGCSNLAGDLSFQEGLTSIGYGAFCACRGLKSVSFPEGLTSIGNSAFSGCSSLTGGLSFPKGLTSIGNSAFSGCSSLTGGLSFPKGLTSIGYRAFEDCSSLTGGLSFQEGLTSIGNSAFEDCSSLTGGLSFPVGLTSIGASAFKGCGSLTGGLSFPKGLTSIGDEAFCECRSLTGGLIFPEGLTSIGWNVFEGCSSLTGGLSFPEGLTSIGRMAFYGCSGLSGSLSFPEGLTSIGDQAFCECSSLTGGLSFPEGLTSIESYTFCGCRGLKSVSFSEGLTSIGNGAFSGCSGLTGELDFPEDLTSIGKFAFEGCSSLICGLSFPEGLTSIEEYTFYKCSGLNSVSFPEGLTSIGFRAFYGCNGLKSVSFPEGLTSIGDEAFYECSSLTGGLSFPEGLTSIGNDAFSECSDLSSVSFPKGLTSIGFRAFYGCNGLKSVSFPEGLTSIGSDTFRGCSGLTGGLSFPEGLTSIGYGAFDGCSGLNRLSFPEGLTSIGDRAFWGCSSLTGELSFPESLTSIGNRAFYECRGLKSVSFSEGLTDIGAYAFEECKGLNNIKVPESVSEIGDYSLGYIANYDGYDYLHKKMNNFTIIGKRGSAAETYALENGFIFVDEDASAPNTPALTEPSTEPTTKPDTSSVPLPGVSSGNPSGSGTPVVPPAAVQKGKAVQLSAENLLPGVAGNSVTWSSSNPKVAIVDKNGKVKGKGYGTVTITATATDGSGRTAQCKLTIGYGISYKLKGGKNNNGNPAAYYMSAVKLKNPSRKGYAFKGWYTDKKYKKKLTTIKASSKKNLTLYAKWQKIKVGGTSITTLKNQAGKKAILKFKRTSNVTGYEIVYSTDKKFKKNCKTISTKKTSATLKKLEKGKTYFVKVRAYKKDSAGKRVYGKYSASKKIKIKK